MDSAQQTPDFDVYTEADRAVMDLYGRGWLSAVGETGATRRTIEVVLSNAYDAGRRAQLAADVAEIRRIVAATNPLPLAAAALTAIADRLAMIGGR